LSNGARTPYALERLDRNDRALTREST